MLMVGEYTTWIPTAGSSTVTFAIELSLSLRGSPVLPYQSDVWADWRRDEHQFPAAFKERKIWFDSGESEACLEIDENTWC